MNILKKDAMHAAGSLQVYVGQQTEAKATACAIYDVYNDEQLEALSIFDAENGLNLINKNIMLHNFFIVYPTISSCALNCYH